MPDAAKLTIGAPAAVTGLLAVISLITGCTWKICNYLGDIRSDQRDSIRVQTELRASIDEVKGSMYSLSRASEVALRQALENPGLKVVDPRDPSKVIVVRPGASSSAGGGYP